jgi:diadenosine tetraphosphate (Ap4A) HIT family hydrolase
MTSPTCPFCTLPIGRIIDSNDHGMVVRDGFPISTGHTLVIPKRHIGSFFELTADERQSLLSLLDTAKEVLLSQVRIFFQSGTGLRFL